MGYDEFVTVESTEQSANSLQTVPPVYRHYHNALDYNEQISFEFFGYDTFL